MRTAKRTLCLLLSVLLLVGLAPERAEAAGSVCFTAVNDQLLPLSDDTMPFWSGGTLYVPYTVLTPDRDPPELGVHYSRNREKTTVVLYKGLRGAITFNYTTGAVETNNGQTYSGSVILRGDVVFLPLDIICNFFSLSYTYTRISYGYLVRVKSESVVLPDSTFIDAAGSSMAQRYAAYERAHAPAAEDPSTTVNSDRPRDTAQRTVYFVVESTDAARTVQLSSYFTVGRAAYLFAPEALREADDLLRRLVAGSDAVALRIDASAGADAALAQIGDANRALWAAANVKTRLVYLDGASDDTLRAVAEAGYCPLRFALDFSAGSTAVTRMSARVISAADANGGSCCVFLGTDEIAPTSLSALLASLRSSNCMPARLNEIAVS